MFSISLVRQSHKAPQEPSRLAMAARTTHTSMSSTRRVWLMERKLRRKRASRLDFT